MDKKNSVFSTFISDIVLEEKHDGSIFEYFLTKLLFTGLLRLALQTICNEFEIIYHFYYLLFVA